MNEKLIRVIKTDTNNPTEKKMDSYDHKHEGIMDLGWEGLGDSLKLLVSKVAKDYQPEVVIGIAKGGVIPAVFISSAFLVDFFPIKLSRRKNEQIVREEPAWFVRPPSDIKNLRVLLVDDIAVSGVVLDMAKQAVMAAGAKEVRTATLVVHSDSVKPDYFAIQTDDLILMPWDKQVFEKSEWKLNPEYAGEIEDIEKQKSQSE
jgi:hypoxanthine phosphoribosyltransferase